MSLKTVYEKVDSKEIVERKKTLRDGDFVSTILFTDAYGQKGYWETIAFTYGQYHDEVRSYSKKEAEHVHDSMVVVHLDSSAPINYPFFDRPRIVLIAVTIILGILSALRFIFGGES